MTTIRYISPDPRAGRQVTLAPALAQRMIDAKRAEEVRVKRSDAEPVKTLNQTVGEKPHHRK